MKYLINNENIEILKNKYGFDMDSIVNYNNTKIFKNYDVFDVGFDDIEFEIDNEIFVDVENDDEFVDNIIILCIINHYIKGIELNDEFEFELYKRFINIDDVEIINRINNKDNLSYWNFYKFVNNHINYNFINFIYNLLNDNDIYINSIFENYELNENDVDLKNRFIIENYCIDDILKINNNNNYVENYNELIECIYIYDKNDVYYDIDELFEINDRLTYYVDYDKIIDDLIIENYYYEFENVYIHNCYF